MPDNASSRPKSASTVLTTLTQKPVLIGAGAAVVLLGGAGAGLWLMNQSRNQPGELPMGAEVVPQSALMSLSFTTDSSQWIRLREFGTKESQTAFDQSLAQLRDRLLTANGINYDQDIKPWVGPEATVAFLAPQAILPDPKAKDKAQQEIKPLAQQQATIVILPIQNPVQAKLILTKSRPDSTAKLVDRSYQGFTIKEYQAKEGGNGTAAQNYAVTALDDKYLVMTTDPKAIDQVIDTYKGGSSLAATPGFAQAMGKIQAPDGKAFGKAFVNLPAAAAASAGNSARTQPQALAQAQQNQGIAATMNLADSGIAFKSVTWLKPDSQRKYEVRNEAKTMASRLPADTLLMASGGNLKTLWQDYSQGVAVNPVAPIKPEVFKNSVQSLVELDLEKDLLSWMGGEFSLALVAPDSGGQNLPFGLVFMVQSSDRRAAEGTLKRLNDLMSSKYKFKVEETKVKDQPVTNWTMNAGGPAITHGWLSNNVVFLSLGAPLAETLVPKPPQTLADSEAFKSGVPTGLSPNNGNFFVNVDKAVNEKKLPLLQLPAPNRDLFAAIRTLGITAAVSDERSIVYEAFVKLNRAGRPTPLPSPTQPLAPPSPSPSLAPTPTPTP